MRLLALHLRAGRLWWVALVLLLAELTLLLLRSHYWVGIWPEAGAAAASTAAYLSIAAAGVAAWTSGARARDHLVEQLEAAGRHRVRVEGTRLLAVLVAVLAPYSAGAVITFALTAPTFPPGIGLWGLYLCLGAVLMGIATGWGWLLGRYLGARIASTAAVLTWLLFLAFVADPAGLVVVAGPAWLTPSPAGLAATASALALLLSAVVLALPPSRPWRHRRAPVLLPLTATGLVLATVLSAPGIVLREVPERALCFTSTARFCLWPEHARYQDVLEPVAARFTGLPRQLDIPETFREHGLRRIAPLGATTSSEPTGDFLLSEGSTAPLASTLAIAITRTTFDYDRCEIAAIQEEPVTEAINRWLELTLAGADPTGDLTITGATDPAWAVGEEVYTRPHDEQLEWVNHEVARVQAQACTT